MQKILTVQNPVIDQIAPRIATDQTATHLVTDQPVPHTATRPVTGQSAHRPATDQPVPHTATRPVTGQSAHRPATDQPVPHTATRPVTGQSAHRPATYRLRRTKKSSRNQGYPRVPIGRKAVLMHNPARYLFGTFPDMAGSAVWACAAALCHSSRPQAATQNLPPRLQMPEIQRCDS